MELVARLKLEVVVRSKGVGCLSYMAVHFSSFLSFAAIPSHTSSSLHLRNSS